MGKVKQMKKKQLKCVCGLCWVFGGGLEGCGTERKEPIDVHDGEGGRAGEEGASWGLSPKT